MQVSNELDSYTVQRTRLEVLQNYCRSVVRPDEDLLKLMMCQYEEYLAAEQGSWMAI